MLITLSHAKPKNALLATIVILVLSLSATSRAQDSVEKVATQETSEIDRPTELAIPIEEIVVTSRRTFYRLNVQLRDAQQRLFNDYNELNELDKFDVDCRRSNWTGSHINNSLECWPDFFEKVVSQNAQDDRMGIGILIPVKQLANQHSGEFDELRGNVLRIANENQVVLEALLEVGKLEAAIKRKRDECMAKPALLFVFRICKSG